jgi:Xaa-Pro aminopeptidase
MNLKVRFFVLIVSIVFSNFAATQMFAGDLDENDPNKVIKVAPPAPVFTDAERKAELAKRRKQVADAMADDSMLILFSADSKLYTNDVEYVYRQENNLYYLTALKQNGVMLAMTKKDGVVKEILFLPKRNPQFETWNGRMYSNEDATRLSGIKTIVDTKYFKEFQEAVKNKQAFTAADESFSNTFIPKNLYILQGNRREFADENMFADSLQGYSVRNALPIFAKLRLVKSPYEIKLMRHAIAITNEGIMRAMGMIDKADWEYEVQAEVEYTFRRRNADFWGYPSIVGCGLNATTLHYVESQGKVLSGDLMLMDVGAEYDHYTADITRTFPVNGKFTKEQADIYKIVYDAQEAAAAKLKPGVSVGEASLAARQVIIEGLYKLGLITEKNSNQYRLWYMHGWGHWLGMNVHDVGNGGTPLQEGMITTNEPGIYIREDALDYLEDTPENRAFLAKIKPAFEKYKNIGVRIEDDMLITKTGVEWMTKDLPRKLEDVEAFMARAKKEMRNYSILRNDLNPALAVNVLDFNNQTKTRKIHSH